jgi:DNA-binding transcriptional ArsR family regulator
VEDLNPVIHQPTRLKIMAALAGLDAGVRVDFGFVQDLLSLSEGNLSVHLQKLEKGRLIRTAKEFVNRRPKTWIWITPEGRKAFERYVANFEKIINGGQGT